MTRVRVLAGLPVEQHSSPNSGGDMSGHHGLVLHIAEGTYRGTIAWQLNPDQRYASGGSVTTCSTWIVGREHGEWAQMVDTNRIAWCQRGGSRDWLSIELAGYAPAAPTAWQVEACAQLLAWAHQQHGIPLAVADHPGERGLGHHSMDREWLGEEWGHDACPGSGVITAKSAIVARAKAVVAGEDDIMPTAAEIVDELLSRELPSPTLGDRTVADWLKGGHLANRGVGTVRAEVAAVATAVAGVATAVGADPVDEQAIVAGVLAGLDPAAIAAAIPTDLADQVADELASRLGQGQARE